MNSAETGQTFSEYLNQVRVDAAREILRSSNKRLYEIAEEVGYTSVEHFSRTFKRITGVSPGKFT